MESKDFYRSLSFLSLGLKYLHLTKVIAEQIIQNQNRIVATWWGEKSPEEEEDELNCQTKWSDIRLVEPFLFNLFHGLELLLKGFVLFKQEGSTKLDHKLTILFHSFVEKYPSEHELITLFNRYSDDSAMPLLLQDFFNSNESSVDEYYQLLRYPFSYKFTKKYNHFNLKYKGAMGLPFYEDLVADIDCLTKKAVSLGRRLEQDNVAIASGTSRQG